MKKLILLIVFAFMFSLTGNARNYLNIEKTYSSISDKEISTFLVLKESENSNLIQIGSRNLNIQYTIISENIDVDICGRIAFLVAEVLRRLDFDNKTILYVTLVVMQTCRAM